VLPPPFHPELPFEPPHDEPFPLLPHPELLLELPPPRPELLFELPLQPPLPLLLELPPGTPNPPGLPF
jgi:hypothetical protein